MTDNITDNNTHIEAEEKEEIMRSLLHKEGNWVDWGKKSQKLQKAGINPQEIFEKTGLQNSQQNLVIVASQVYDSLILSGAKETTLEYYQGPRSDVLYELRILNHEDRLKAALVCQEKALDVDGAKEVAKAIKHFSRLSQPPTGFTPHPGDAVAYQYWKSAKQKKTLTDRARLIAEGLKFASSEDARNQIQQLLSDIVNSESLVNAPLLPVYRLEEEDQLPCILPVVGSFPLSPDNLENITPLESQEPFGVVSLHEPLQIVSIPRWQVILLAKNPVVAFCNTTDLPNETQVKPENLLVVIDLEEKTWDITNYFLVNEGGQLRLKWLSRESEGEIIGKLLVILKQKKILDEANLEQPWQMDD